MQAVVLASDRDDGGRDRLSDPFWGLLAGSCAELVRLAAIRVLQRGATT